jgi:hypothetical protein
MDIADKSFEKLPTTIYASADEALSNNDKQKGDTVYLA